MTNNARAPYTVLNVEIHYHYQGYKVQNELKQMLVNELERPMIRRIKDTKLIFRRDI